MFPRHPRPTAEQKEGILRLMRDGVPIRTACARVGTGHHAAEREVEADPDFGAAWREIIDGRLVMGKERQAEFLKMLDDGRRPLEACRMIGVAYDAAWKTAQRHPGFRAEWQSRRPAAGPPSEEQRARVIALLREGRPVVEATEEAGLPLRAAYTLRATDLEFRRQWRAALGQGPEFTKAMQADFLKLVRAGMAASVAAEALRINWATVKRVRMRDRRFAALWEWAVAAQYVPLEKRLGKFRGPSS